nr:heme lyase [Microheliella maris]BDN85888.1 heme lyase [Microheliella maris]
MLVQFSKYILFFSFIGTICSYVYILTYKKAKIQLTFLKIFLDFYFLTSVLIWISCLFFFLLNFLRSNFNLISVFEHSHSLQPMLYKLCASWGNHEGSMLLWCSLLSFYNFFFWQQIKSFIKLNTIKSVERLLISTFFFQFFLLYTSNPFQTKFNFSLQGLELNPILQDVGLAIHPPMLYAGYLATIIIYSMIFLLADSKTFLTQIIKLLKFWLIISWLFLTIGITLGSWWAYYELGWGGWWFWDPVENISLIPWIFLTSLIHLIIVNKKEIIFNTWFYINIFFLFFLTVLGTFFVRAGFLDSVHSFAASPDKGIILLCFLFWIFIDFLHFINFFKKLKFQFLQKKKFTEIIFLVSGIFFIIVLILITGIITPLILNVFKIREISLGPPYYNGVLIPIFLPLLFFMILSPFFKIQGITFKQVILFSIGFLMGCFYILIKIPESFNFNLEIICIFFCLWATLLLFLIGYLTKFLNKPMLISHFGIILFIFSVTISKFYEVEYNHVLQLGESISINGFEFIFRSINEMLNQNYYSTYGNFLITFNNNFIGVCFPEKRFFFLQDLFLSKTANLTNFYGNFVITFGDGNFKDGWLVQILIQPFLSGIWLSAFIIFLGILFLLKKHIKKTFYKLY